MPGCRQGDIAVIFTVGDTTGLARAVMQAAIGKPVRLLGLREPVGNGGCSADFVWRFEQPLVVEVQGCVATIHGASDRVLKPFRGLDEDENIKRESAHKEPA